MTEPMVRLLEAQAALDNPTWTLLRQGRAAVVVATVLPLVEQGVSSIATNEFHALAARVFAVARDRDSSFGVDPDDPRAVREECRSWVSARWLERSGDADGEIYRLSSEARDGIDLVRRLSATRAAMSESQVALVLDSARLLALKATADREQRMRALREEMDELEYRLGQRRAELDRLEDGGEVEVAADEEVLNDFLRLRDEIERLPGDLQRVEDSYRGLVQQVRDDFLAESRPHGEIIGDYLRTAEELSTADRYGRGFAQAKQLLTDDLLQARLQQDLARIVEHPFSVALDERERADLRRTVFVVADSVSAVLEQRRLMTRRLVAFITSRDSVRERALSEGLRAAEHRLLDWARQHGSRATVALPVGHWADDAGVTDGPVMSRGEAGLAHVATMREKPRTIRAATPMLTLDEASGTGRPEFSAAELRAKGGPFYTELADAIDAATQDGVGVGAAALFNSLPDSTRRPVDLHGLLHLATRRDALRPGMPVETFQTVRPSGEAVWFEAPAVTFVADRDLTDEPGVRGGGYDDGGSS